MGSGGTPWGLPQPRRESHGVHSAVRSMRVWEAPAPVPGGRGAGAGLLAHRCARRFLPAGFFRQVPDTAAAIVLKAVGVSRRDLPDTFFLILRRPGGIYPKLKPVGFRVCSEF